MDNLVSDLLHQYELTRKADNTEFYKLSFDGKVYFIIRSINVFYQPYKMYHIRKWRKNQSYNLTYTNTKKWHDTIEMTYLGEDPFHMSLKDALVIVELDKL